jgi:hypothetical protein
MQTWVLGHHFTLSEEVVLIPEILTNLRYSTFWLVAQGE